MRNISVLLAMLAVLLLAATTQADVIHRWGFDEVGGAGTSLLDSVGGADATIVQVGDLNADVGMTYAGQAYLTGGWKDGADYVALPNGLYTGLGDITIETWATTYSSPNWGRIFSFGENDANNLMMSWTQGTNQNSDRVAFKLGGGGEANIDNQMQPYIYGQEYHIALTLTDDWNGGGETQIKVYMDGVHKGTVNTPYNLQDLPDLNNWIGRSKYGDSTANASYNEFRIYDTALLDAEVLASFTKGPGWTTAAFTFDDGEPADSLWSSSANWNDEEAAADPLAPPIDTTPVTIAAGAAQVSAPAVAWSVDLTGGSLTIDAGQTLTVGGATTVTSPATITINGTLDTKNFNNDGMTTLPAGSTLLSGGGTMAGITTLGDATVGGGNTTTLNLAAASTFTKAGDGTLSAETVTAAANTTFRISGGTLAVGGAKPLGDSTQALELDGGTIQIAGEATGGDANFRYYRFTATETGNGQLQYSELQYFLDDVRTPATAVTWDAGVWDAAVQANDDNINSKFCTGDALGHMVYDFGSPTAFDEYNWATADDLTPDRNPGRWTVEGSDDNATWTMIDDRTDADQITPTTLRTWAGPSNTQFDGYSLSSIVNGPINLPDTDINVTDDSILNAVTDTTATFGVLTYTNGKTLTVVGARDGIGFTGVTFPAMGSVGLNANTPTTLGSLTNSAGATLNKGGTSSLIFDGNANLTSGLLISLNEGTLALTNATGGQDITYADPLAVGGNGTLAAGKYLAGADGPQIVTVSDVTLNAGILAFETTDGYSLVLPALTANGGGINAGSADVTLDGLLYAADGSVLTTQGAAPVMFNATTLTGLANVGMNAQTVTTLGALTDSTGVVMTLSGPQHAPGTAGLVFDGENNLVDGMALTLAGSTLGLTDATVDPGVTYVEPVTVTGDSTLAAGKYVVGLDGPQTVTVDSVALNSGILTLGTADDYSLVLGAMTSTGGSIGFVPGANNVTLPAGASTQDLILGGDVTNVIGLDTLTVNGGIKIRPSAAVPVIDYGLDTGVSNIEIGDNDAFNGEVMLSGMTAAASGNLRIVRSVTNVPDVASLTTGNIQFDQNNREEIAVLQTNGLLERNTGGGAGEVQWSQDGGFAAKDAPLTVTLNSNANLDWGSDLNGRALQFGSPTADDVVELTNSIELGNGWRPLNVADNPDSRTDKLVLSGNISSTGGGVWECLVINEHQGPDDAPFNPRTGGDWRTVKSPLIELTGTNTFTQSLRIDGGCVFGIDGVGIPAASRVWFQKHNWEAEAVWLSNGTIARNIGDDPGNVKWDWSGGGFAARGGPLTVTLEGGDTLRWGAWDYGFNGRHLNLGSSYATDVTTFTNPVNGEGGWRDMEIGDNPDTTDDYVVVTGAWTNFANLSIRYRGADRREAAGRMDFGTAAVPNTIEISERFRVYDGALVNYYTDFTVGAEFDVENDASANIHGDLNIGGLNWGRVFVYNNSTLNVDGDLNGLTGGGDAIWVRGGSALTVDGSVYNGSRPIGAYGGSTIDIGGDLAMGDVIEVHEASVINVAGNVTNNNRIFMQHEGTELNIGGDYTGTNHIDMYRGAVLNVTGDMVTGRIWAESNNLPGGEINIGGNLTTPNGEVVILNGVHATVAGNVDVGTNRVYVGWDNDSLLDVGGNLSANRLEMFNRGATLNVAGDATFTGGQIRIGDGREPGNGPFLNVTGALIKTGNGEFGINWYGQVTTGPGSSIECRTFWVQDAAEVFIDGDVSIIDNGDLYARNNGGGKIMITGDLNKTGNGEMRFRDGSEVTVLGGGDTTSRYLEAQQGSVVDLGSVNVTINEWQVFIDGGSTFKTTGDFSRPDVGPVEWWERQIRVSEGSTFDVSNTAAGNEVHAGFFEIRNAGTVANFGDADVFSTDRVWMGGGGMPYCHIGGNLTVSVPGRGDAIGLDEGILDVGGTVFAHRVQIFDDATLQANNVTVQDELYVNTAGAISPGTTAGPLGTMTIDAQGADGGARQLRFNNGGGLYRWEIGSAGAAGTDYDTVVLATGTKLVMEGWDDDLGWDLLVTDTGSGDVVTSDVFTILSYDPTTNGNVPLETVRHTWVDEEVVTTGPTTPADIALIDVVLDANAPMWWDTSGATITNTGTSLEMTGLHAPSMLQSTMTGLFDQGTTWNKTTVVPDATQGAAILSGHTVSVSTAGQTVAQADIQDGGMLEVTSTGVLGAPTPVQVINVAGQLAVRTGGTLNADLVNSTGTTTVESGGTLSATVLNTSGDSSFEAAATVSIGTMNVAAGTHAIADGSGVDVGDLNVTGGATTMTAGNLAVTNVQIKDGTVDTGAGALQVSEMLKFGGVQYSLTGAANFTAASAVAGSGLATGANLTVNGGTIAIQGGVAMPNGLNVWLDASTITAANGDSIATWADVSGNGNDATQGDGGIQPTYVAASGLNAQPAVHFAQDNEDWGDRMLLGDLSAQFPTGATMIAVFTPDEAANKRYNIFGNTGQDTRWCAANWNESVPGEFRTSRTGNQNYAAWPATENAIVVLESDSDVYRILIDGAVVNDSAAAYSDGSGTNWTIANRQQGGQAFNGDIAEFMLFDNVLSAEAINNIGGYLAAKYGLTTAYDGALGGNAEQATTNVTVAANSVLTSDNTGVMLGNLTVQAGVTSLELQNASYSFQDVSIANGAAIAGELEVRGTLDVDKMTVDGGGELSFAPSAVYNAEVTLGDGDALAVDADKITVQNDSSIVVGGTLAPKGVGRTKSDFFVP
ncbi:MAG: hypothetical protein HQ567_06565, partial [Candidatus Nealsonbacteria bacterium]|nr:hypothetical protein [Candidatus Nealsonbacteria bacterium]